MLRPSPRSTLLPYTTLFRSFVEPDEWFEKVPGYLRQGTNPIEKTRYLDRICDIVGRLNDWENVTTRSDLPTGFKGGIPDAGDGELPPKVSEGSATLRAVATNGDEYVATNFSLL